MRKYGRDNRPYVKPVKRIELSEKNVKLRWIAIVVLLGIGVVGIGAGLMSALNTEPGWQEVEVSSREANCAGEFTLMYDFSSAGGGATAQYKQLTALYTEAAEKAYRLFSAEVVEEGLYNIGWLNAHVNEPVKVESELYGALSLAAAYDNRHIFTAPAMVEYNRVFLCENDEEAARYLPSGDPEMVAWLAELGSFVNDPEMIRLELIGEDQVQLTVSEEYLAYAQFHEIETFLDFGWMKNAFVADYLASVLTQNGYTNGYLVSYDGFTRNLDQRGMEYTFNLFDRKGTEINMPAQMAYHVPMSIVFLRDYPMNELDRWHYFAFADGNVVTAMLDTADCMSKSSAHNLVGYSVTAGCGEILLQMAPQFTADTLDEAALKAMPENDIHAIWFEGRNLLHTDPKLKLTVNADGGGESYTHGLAK